MQLYFWERAKAACYLYVAYVRNVVAAILNLILLLRKIAIGESSIPWNRSLRAKTEEGVIGGRLPSIFYNSTWRYASRTSECAPQRKRLQYTGHTELQILLSITLFYRKNYICIATTSFFKMRIGSSPQR